MAEWVDLQRELDAWRGLGRTAAFWWRDDDASTVTPALERLLALRREVSVPLALAVVPSAADDALARRLADEPQVSVLQHGYAHANYAPRGEKKQELGAHRTAEHMGRELSAGRRRLEQLFGRRALPVLVPPWNRADGAIISALPGLGFTGISLLGPRDPRSSPALARVNVHVDIIAWKTHRGFVGRAEALERVLGHLAGRRTGQFDAEEPTGLMTHHLDHDAGCWEFVTELLRRTTDHPAVRWLSPWGRTTATF